MTCPSLRSALIALILAFCPALSLANCTMSGNTASVSVTIASPISIDPHAAVGTVLATSPVTSPSPSNSSVNCYGYTRIGVVNLVGSQPGGNSTIFATGVSGVGYRVLHPDSSYELPPYGSDTVASGSYNLSVASAIQLVKTGPIASGSTLGSGTLGYWQFDGYFGSLRTEDFRLANPVTFIGYTCTVTTPNIAVTLPTISTTSLANVGATSGATAFNIGLNCPTNAAGHVLAIEFDASSVVSGATGVIRPSSGGAANVGVQLTDDAFNPVNFGTPATVGTAVNGSNSFTYFARYYAIGKPVGAGIVNAAATFTISYP